MCVPFAHMCVCVYICVVLECGIEVNGARAFAQIIKRNKRIVNVSLAGKTAAHVCVCVCVWAHKRNRQTHGV